MIAFKGFTKDLWSRLGDGNEDNCRFVPGEKKTVEESKTARTGFHCCENPFDCCTYYDLDGSNRFFKVEAAGDIDEDEMGRIACTEITLIKELTTMEFAYEGMCYMIDHPQRSGWQSGKHNVQVQKDVASAAGSGKIAIARGKRPKVKGVFGSILGLMMENDAGEIIEAKLFRCSEDQAGKWIEIGPERKVVQA